VDALKILLVTQPDEEAFSKLSAVQQLKLVSSWTSDAAMALIKDPDAHPLEVKSTLARGGGRDTLGVFAGRFIPKGHLVCLYPGLISSPSQFQKRLDSGDGKIEVSHCTALFDGSVIDPDAFQPVRPNPCAVAHLCNHPPKGALPNVCKAVFVWPDTYVEENEINKMDSASGGVEDLVDIYGKQVRGLGLISLRNIDEGEEIYVNFRFNPKLKDQWPSWYTPVDEYEDDSRWSA